MREYVVENEFVKAVRAVGGVAYKLTSQTANGLPDRLVLFFPAKTVFVELKAPGKQLRPLQRKRRYQLMKLGFPVLCIDRFSQIKPCIDAILNWTPGTPFPENIGAKVPDLDITTLPGEHSDLDDFGDKTKPFLEKCISSLEKQEFQDYEIIIVDDGSPDDSGAYADYIADKYKNIIVIHQENKGLFHARITAFKEARGEYILSVDSDDWVSDNYFEEIERAIQKESPDILVFDNYYSSKNGDRPFHVYNTGTRVWEGSEINSFIYDFFSSNRNNAIWRKVIKRELLDLETVTEYPRITMTEDWIHSFFPIMNASKIMYLPMPLYYYRYQQNPFEKGTLFLFMGKRSDRMKGLLWCGSGFLLLYKRFEDGRLSWPRNTEEAAEITEEQYGQLMMGLNPLSPKVKEVSPSRLC